MTDSLQFSDQHPIIPASIDAEILKMKEYVQQPNLESHSVGLKAIGRGLFSFFLQCISLQKKEDPVHANLSEIHKKLKIAEANVRKLQNTTQQKLRAAEVDINRRGPQSATVAKGQILEKQSGVLLSNNNRLNEAQEKLSLIQDELKSFPDFLLKNRVKLLKNLDRAQMNLASRIQGALATNEQAIIKLDPHSLALNQIEKEIKQLSLLPSGKEVRMLESEIVDKADALLEKLSQFERSKTEFKLTETTCSPFKEFNDSKEEILQTKVKLLKDRFAKNPFYREAKINFTLSAFNAFVPKQLQLPPSIQTALALAMQDSENNSQVEIIIDNFQKQKNHIPSLHDLSQLKEIALKTGPKTKENFTTAEEALASMSQKNLTEEFQEFFKTCLECEVAIASSTVKREFEDITSIYSDTTPEQQKFFLEFLTKRQNIDQKLEQLMELPQKGKWRSESDLKKALKEIESDLSSLQSRDEESLFNDSMDGKKDILQQKITIYAKRFDNDEQYRKTKIEQNMSLLTSKLPLSPLAQKKLKENMGVTKNNDQVEMLLTDYSQGKPVTLEHLEVLIKVIKETFDNLPREAFALISSEGDAIVEDAIVELEKLKVPFIEKKLQNTEKALEKAQLELKNIGHQINEEIKYIRENSSLPTMKAIIAAKVKLIQDKLTRLATSLTILNNRLDVEVGPNLQNKAAGIKEQIKKMQDHIKTDQDRCLNVLDIESLTTFCNELKSVLVKDLSTLSQLEETPALIQKKGALNHKLDQISSGLQKVEEFKIPDNILRQSKSSEIISTFDELYVSYDKLKSIQDKCIEYLQMSKVYNFSEDRLIPIKNMINKNELLLIEIENQKIQLFEEKFNKTDEEVKLLFQKTQHLIGSNAIPINQKFALLEILQIKDADFNGMSIWTEFLELASEAKLNNQINLDKKAIFATQNFLAGFITENIVLPLSSHSDFSFFREINPLSMFLNSHIGTAVNTQLVTDSIPRIEASGTYTRTLGTLDAQEALITPTSSAQEKKLIEDRYIYSPGYGLWAKNTWTASQDTQGLLKIEGVGNLAFERTDKSFLHKEIRQTFDFSSLGRINPEKISGAFSLLKSILAGQYSIKGNLKLISEDCRSFFSAGDEFWKWVDSEDYDKNPDLAMRLEEKNKVLEEHATLTAHLMPSVYDFDRALTAAFME